MNGLSIDGAWEFTVDELNACGAAIGIQTWPTVLDMPRLATSRSDCSTAENSDGDRATTYEPDERLIALLRVIEHTDLYLEIRVVSDDPVRACIAIDGPAAAQAVQKGDEVRVRELGCGMDAVAAATADIIGHVHAADLRPTSVPIVDLADRLGTATTAIEYADALHACGIRDRDAAVTAAALHDWTARAEIVAIRPGRGATVSPAATVVLDGRAGRVVVSPSRSPDGAVWMTFASGTRERLRQALTALVETLDDRP